MTNFIRELPILNKEIQDKVYEYVEKNTQDLKTSELYSSVEDKKFVDLDKRSSKFKTFSEPFLFDKIEQLVKEINKLDDYYSFTLVRNNVTYIEYGKGDFFKEHEDYLSVTSNVIEEFTLLLCMDADCTGGETILHLNKLFNHESKSSITKYHGLLFRKDIRHEGKILTSGYKKILTLNLWAVPKSSDKLFILKFKDGKQAINNFNKIQTFDNLLETLIEQYDSNERIIYYEEANFTYDEFQIVQKVLDRSYITLKDYDTYKYVLDYYAIDCKNIVIDDINNLSALNDYKQTLDDPIIIFPNEDTHQYILELVKKEKLPLIPFQLVLVEGNIAYGGEMTGTPTYSFKMTPVYMSMSEYNNILFAQTICTEDDFESFDRLINCSDYEFIPNKKITFSYEADITEDKQFIDHECNHYIIPGLELYKRKYTNKHSIIADICKPDFSVYEYIGNIKDEQKGKYYHIDKDNKMYIPYDKTGLIIERLQTIGFGNNILPIMKKTKFKFPQQKEYIEHNFCNEDIYGNFKLYYITGFINME